MALHDFKEAYDRRKAQPVARRSLAGLVGGVAGWASAHLPRLRTTLLSVGGFGFVSAAAWDVARPLGLLSIGLSLLAIEYLTGGESE